MQRGAGDVAVVNGWRPHRGRLAANSTASAHPARTGLCRSDRRLDGGSDVARRPDVGQQRHWFDGVAHRHVPGRRRGEPALVLALPRVLRLRADEWDSPIVRVLADEVTRLTLGPGSRARPTARRPARLGAAYVVRAPRIQGTVSYAAQSDPVVGPALRLLENNPQRPWTVEDLARCSGVSRATRLDRFTEVVGEPPIAFLTGWRLTLAADCYARSRRR